jgi:hypothetical protein
LFFKKKDQGKKLEANKKDKKINIFVFSKFSEQTKTKT